MHAAEISLWAIIDSAEMSALEKDDAFSELLDGLFAAGRAAGLEEGAGEISAILCRGSIDDFPGEGDGNDRYRKFEVLVSTLRARAGKGEG